MHIYSDTIYSNVIHRFIATFLGLTTALYLIVANLLGGI